MNITKNFKIDEFFRSLKATEKGIINLPPKGDATLDVTMNIAGIAIAVLQPVRDRFPKWTINITSGYRNEELNKAVGGSKTSSHLTGCAVDFKSAGNMTSIFDFIRLNLDYDQLIWEFGDESKPDWIHVSYKRCGGNRRQVLRAVKENGKTIYKNF